MREKANMQGKPKPVRAHEREVGKGEKMKSIIQSINPEHVFNMRFGGKRFPLKRIEVRKTAPDETPFKAYIYETKQKEKSFISKTIDGVETKVIIRRGGCGKVVGEYICRKVEIVRADNMIQAYYSNRLETRLTDDNFLLMQTENRLNSCIWRT